MVSLSQKINLLFCLFFTVFYSYQLIYVFVSLLKRRKKYTAKNKHRYAVLIAARNESNVIANLIDSIKAQNYPSELCDVYVIADNCTDDTAEIAKCAGAEVFIRFSETEKGKGYALDYGFSKIFELYGEDYYDGFFVFDADNLLDKNYIAEMNSVFDSGYNVVTSYRNTKNYDTNWLSAGSSLWFLREARFINDPRMMLGTGCAVSGTGFLMSREVVLKNNGWKYFLLTEDIEFSISCAIDGEKIGYAADAIFYDEQPSTFRDSWNQRLRWAKGFYQIIAAYGKTLFVSIFKKKSFTCYDMLMTVIPAMGVTVLSIIFNLAMFVYALLGAAKLFPLANTSVMALISVLFSFYFMLFVFGAITMLTENKRVSASTKSKIIYLFTFPIFIFTYIPISIVALFKKVEWTPIHHSVSKRIEEFKS